MGHGLDKGIESPRTTVTPEPGIHLRRGSTVKENRIAESNRR